MDNEHGFSLLLNIGKAFVGIIGFIAAMIGIRKDLTSKKEVIKESADGYDDDLID